MELRRGGRNVILGCKFGLILAVVSTVSFHKKCRFVDFDIAAQWFDSCKRDSDHAVFMNYMIM